MWTEFRAFAARIGLSREQVEAVERAGVPTYVPDPLNSDVEYRVRPDADWTQRMTDAWNGVLVNSRRQTAGVIPIRGGRLRVADSWLPEQGVTAEVAAGDYEIILTIAHLGAEEDGDYEEHVSHVWALLCGNEAVGLIEPITADDGTEIDVEMVTTVFAGTGVIERLAAEHGDGQLLTTNVLIPAMCEADPAGCKWARVAIDEEAGALVAIAAGDGRGTYPLFRIADPDEKTVGVLIDFFVDNRTD